jgi:hypothetical protein
LNRTAANAIAGLPNGTTQADDATSGPLDFAAFDPSGQVAGGDDTMPPFTGDDLGGGFEFSIGGICSTPQTTFWLNSNGNVTFGAGDTSFSPSAGAFAAGPPRVGAWQDLFAPRFGGSFPVQALGFSNANEFTVRYINDPTFGDALVSRDAPNTFSINMFDDGTGADEGALAAEGPRSTRVAQQPGVQVRSDGSAYWTLYSGRIDNVSSATVGAGFTSGPGPTFSGNISAYAKSYVIGTGAENSLFELFFGGYDLRWEGATEQVSSPNNPVDVGNVVFRAKNCATA